MLLNNAALVPAGKPLKFEHYARATMATGTCVRAFTALDRIDATLPSARFRSTKEDDRLSRAAIQGAAAVPGCLVWTEAMR